MPLRIRVKACLQLLTLVWVITWVATVPLFHTHLPDVNDGRASHQGLAHTVFSPDLPGEFSRAQSSGFHLSTRSQNSPELGFVLSTEEDAKKRTYGEPSPHYLTSSQFSRPLLATSAIESPARHRKFDLLGGHQASRAPPFIISS